MIIAGIWYSIKYFILSLDPLAFIFELTTFSFWLEHKGAWYVAMLIPVYFLYPICYDFIGKRRKTWITFTIGIFLVISFFLYEAYNSIYVHLVQVFNSVLVFAIGSYQGKAVVEKGKFPYALTIAAILFYLVRALMPGISDIAYIGNLSYASLGLGLCLLSSLILQYTPKWIVGFFEFFGKVSLELYLTNIFLLQALNLLTKSMNFQENDNWIIWALIYAGICLWCIVLSYLVRGICTKINQKKMPC